MPAAVIGGVVAAGGAVASAAIGSSGASKAAQATTQAADRAAQVQSENYAKSAAALAPWQQSGLAANGQINALLGIGGGGYQTAPGTTQIAPYDGYQSDYLAAGYGGLPFTAGGNYRRQALGQGRFGLSYTSPAAQTPNAIAMPTQQQAEDAFAKYRNSTGYQFRLNQGMNAVNSGYAGAGTLKSGAAMKAINDYGQDMASQEFGNYLAALGNQQQLGFGAASAQAGVGQNTANSLAQIYQNQGVNLANAALVKAQNSGNMINSLATIAGGMIGRQY